MPEQGLTSGRHRGSSSANASSQRPAASSVALAAGMWHGVYASLIATFRAASNRREALICAVIQQRTPAVSLLQPYSVRLSYGNKSKLGVATPCASPGILRSKGAHNSNFTDATTCRKTTEPEKHLKWCTVPPPRPMLNFM